MSTDMNNVLLLSEGDYYRVPNRLRPMLVSILEANGVEKQYCEPDEEVTIFGEDNQS